MLLSNLNEKQKLLFRDICIFVSLANGKFVKEEKEMVAVYCNEMNIPYSEEPLTADVDEAINEIAEISNDTERRIIAFELIGIAYADGVYHEEERECIDKFSAKTSISEDDLDKMSKLIEQIIRVNNEVTELIMK